MRTAVRKAYDVAANVVVALAFAAAVLFVAGMIWLAASNLLGADSHDVSHDGCTPEPSGWVC